MEASSGYDKKSKQSILNQLKQVVNNKFTDEKCIFYIAYLADFFGFLNVLNLKLQGRTNILKSYDTIEAFLEKQSLWQRRFCATKPNFSSFPRLNAS